MGSKAPTRPEAEQMAAKPVLPPPPPPKRFNQVTLQCRPQMTRLYITQERLDDCCLGRVIDERWNEVAQAWCAEQERLFLAPMIGEGI